MVEVTDSESDFTGVVWSGKVSPGEYLVWKTMLETNFRSKERQLRATSSVSRVLKLGGSGARVQNCVTFVFPTN